MAGNIKNDSNSFYAYVRSKQKVRDKVGPLENNRGNIISDGFKMADVLNEYFSSVFADDTKVFRKVTNETDKQSLQDDLEKLVKWSEKWQFLV